MGDKENKKYPILRIITTLDSMVHERKSNNKIVNPISFNELNEYMDKLFPGSGYRRNNILDSGKVKQYLKGFLPFFEEYNNYFGWKLNVKSDGIYYEPKNDKVDAISSVILNIFEDSNIETSEEFLKEFLEAFSDSDIRSLAEEYDFKPLKEALISSEEIFIFLLMINQTTVLTSELKENISKKIMKWFDIDDRMLWASTTPIDTDSKKVTMNSSIKQHIFTILDTIYYKGYLKCTYSKYNLEKELVAYDNEFIVKPLTILYSEDKFYLIAVTKSYGKEVNRTYRIDKFKKMIPLSDNIEMKLDEKDVDIKSMVMNFDGKSKIETIKIRGKRAILDPLIDRFDESINSIEPDGNDHFITTIENVNRTGMLYWVLQFSTACEVIEPEDFRQEVIENLQETLMRYGVN